MLNKPTSPAKLAERIQTWEFMEMSELLPEFWTERKEKEAALKAGSGRQKRPVIELNVRGCFTVYVGVISVKHPEAVPEMMSYTVPSSELVKTGGKCQMTNFPTLPQQEVGNRWNEKGCYFSRCRFRHVCSGCAGTHPVLDCPYNQGQ